MSQPIKVILVVEWNRFEQRGAYLLRGFPAGLAVLERSFLGWSRNEAVESLAKWNQERAARGFAPVVI